MTQKAKASAAVGSLLVLVIIAVALAASGDSEATSDDPEPSMFETGDDVASVHAEILDGWRGADLNPGGFAAIEVESLGDSLCERGAVAGLEVVLCSYETEAEAAEMTEAAQSLVGNATGAVMTAGHRLVVVVDRNLADRDGKQINALLESFRETATR